MNKTEVSVEVGDLTKVVVVIFVLLTVTPDSPMFHPCKAGLLACGSLRAFAFPPFLWGSGQMKARSPHYSRGGGWGFGHQFRLTHIPFPFQFRRFALMEHLSPFICTADRQRVKPICAACRRNTTVMRESGRLPSCAIRPTAARRQSCHQRWRQMPLQR